MIYMKSRQEIEIMRRAGKIVAETHELLKEAIKPGVTTKELDVMAEDHIRKRGATPAFKGYGGFPASICTSINHEVVHGIPGLKRLEDGDIISIDIGALYEGYYGDAAKTHAVGNVSEEAEKLIKITRESFYEGMKYAFEGNRLSDISHAIQAYVEKEGFSVVRNYVGHGIGTKMHEEPQVPNYGPPGKGPRLQSGMVLAIEPMINAGTYEVKVLSDGWTVITLDGKYSAHYEHTIAITNGEPEILTVL
ncbi:type I methionyl aminopeptidase [Clostridium formicaceticum]|uniref:Methionine aminopeptidase n=1 Tax=Clostridium formicaceticum TaxID=1497 RepID=A0AAC9RPY2_9CLOT|nr:type I methionyl aminopeptidase [Clostridium formicaceticum]AOY75083.1 type I methionyl aminopeptidase [Clostridium formicaceticum]ARE89507.1 Methionine aminopeptidase 1 [Clostridium formicaceticum]